MINHNLFSFRLDSFTILIGALRTVLHFFVSFKGLTHAYLVKTSMIHNKYLLLSFFEQNDCISAKSVAQILFSNLEQTFLFFNFSIIVM